MLVTCSIRSHVIAVSLSRCDLINSQLPMRSLCRCTHCGAPHRYEIHKVGHSRRSGVLARSGKVEWRKGERCGDALVKTIPHPLSPSGSPQSSCKALYDLSFGRQRENIT